MCDFCKNYRRPGSELGLGDIFITRSAMYTRVGDGMEFDIPLNYCPACGKQIAALRTAWNRQAGDTVQVVRCAVCKHFGRNLENETYCSDVRGLSDPKEDDFCPYGERKEGAN